MKVKNINASSNKTRKEIKDSFIRLIEEESHLKNITVTALTKKANITRAAFYTHYDNITDVANEIQEEIMDALLDALKQLDTTDELSIYVDEILKHVFRQKNFYTRILQGELSLHFVQRICNQAEKLLYTYFKNKNIENLELKITFFTEGSINILVKYLKNELKASPEEISNYIKESLKLTFTNQK